MPLEFNYKKKVENIKTKRISILPRFGIYLDFMGREVSLKQVPSLETIYNVVRSGVTLSNLKKITKRQLSEVKFFKDEEKAAVDTTAKAIKTKRLKTKK
jgi:hypothetical protein